MTMVNGHNIYLHYVALAAAKTAHTRTIMETEALRAKHANVWQSAPKVMTILPAFRRYWIKLILDTAPRVLLRMRSSGAETAIHAKPLTADGLYGRLWLP
jgi:hypothetical protein